MSTFRFGDLKLGSDAGAEIDGAQLADAVNARSSLRKCALRSVARRCAIAITVRVS